MTKSHKVVHYILGGVLIINVLFTMYQGKWEAMLGYICALIVYGALHFTMKTVDTYKSLVDWQHGLIDRQQGMINDLLEKQT